MKKISLITVHVVFNFGSSLQTIATCEAVRRTGNKPLLINYCPKRVTYNYFIKTCLKKDISAFDKLYIIAMFCVNKHIYGSFLSKYCAMTKPIYDEDNFSELCPKSDIYLTGSDQVWNSIHNGELNRRYYFDNVYGKKVSFASSFGVEQLPSKEYMEVKRMLAGYDAISVREDSAKELVNSMGYDAVHLQDPIFMLDRYEWYKYASSRIVKERYLFVYVPYNIVDENLLYGVARKIAENKNLKVVTNTQYMKKKPLADITIRFMSPGDFLSLMLYAEFVITNSFHGTAFSINLNKQFCVYMPSAYGTRISSVLHLFGLENRLMNGDEDYLPCDKLVDYSSVNKIIETERQKSMEFLIKHFND